MTNKMPPEKMPSKASENRRATKPIMEKRRRARINQCLTELKTLILDALNKDPSRHSKLEKADILEMTVRHLQSVQRQQMAAAISTDPSVLNKFRAGFSECATEVTRYVGRIDGVDMSMRQRLVSHLTHCVSSLNAATPFPGPHQGMGPGAHPQGPNSGNHPGNNAGGGIAFPGMTPPLLSQLQALNVQIPGNAAGGYGMNSLNFLPAVHAAALAAAGQASGMVNAGSDINNNNPNPTRGGSTSTAPGSSASPSSTTSTGGKFFGGLSLIPSRLPNGDLAFLLPNQGMGNNQLFGLHVNSDSHPGGDPNNPAGRLNHLPWGPPTPTSPMDPISPTLSRRSSCNSPTSSVESALSPTGSEISGHSGFPLVRRHSESALSPKPCSSRASMDSHQRRHPSVIVQAPHGSSPQPPQGDGSLQAPGRDDPVWRPW